MAASSARTGAGHNGRWCSLAAGSCLMLVAGIVYGFGRFSQQFKTLLGCTEGGKQLIALAGTVGLW